MKHKPTVLIVFLVFIYITGCNRIDGEIVKRPVHKSLYLDEIKLYPEWPNDCYVINTSAHKPQVFTVKRITTSCLLEELEDQEGINKHEMLMQYLKNVSDTYIENKCKNENIDIRYKDVIENLMPGEEFWLKWDIEFEIEECKRKIVSKTMDNNGLYYEHNSWEIYYKIYYIQREFSLAGAFSPE